MTPHYLHTLYKEECENMSSFYKKINKINFSLTNSFSFVLLQMIYIVYNYVCDVRIR